MPDRRCALSPLAVKRHVRRPQSDAAQVAGLGRDISIFLSFCGSGAPMRGWLREQWKDTRDNAKRNLWFGRVGQAKPLEYKSAPTEFLPKRVLETASRLRRELTSFIQANGPMPEAASTEDFGALWSWQSRMNGWYEGRIKPAVAPLFDELAEHGLTDTVLDEVIHQNDQTEETIALISQRLTMLASRM
jgi:hypothetical protein